MGSPFRSPRLARDARFSARDPNQELPVYEDRVLERINKTLRRRLSDRIEAVLQAACVTGELDTAADLLVVLGNVRERGHRAFGDERRISDDPVAKAQEELVTRRLVKPQHVVEPAWRNR
jgi:hypothetical protein